MRGETCRLWTHVLELRQLQLLLLHHVTVCLELLHVLQQLAALVQQRVVLRPLPVGAPSDVTQVALEAVDDRLQLVAHRLVLWHVT